MMVLLHFQCLPYWPQMNGKDVIVKAKVKGTSEVTGPFLINKAHTTLLKLENQVCTRSVVFHAYWCYYE